MRAVAYGAFVAPLLLSCLNAAAQTHVVSIEGMLFRPAELVVRQGDRIVWQNKDLVPHTATTAAAGFDTREIRAGASGAWVATGPGRYDYVCTYHPGMKGSLVVK